MKMKKILFLISFIFLFAAFISPTYSSDQKKPDYSGHFGDMDTDGNGQVNWGEFKKYFPHAEENVFKDADGNKNGSVDHEEWHKFKEIQGYSHDHKG